MKGCGKSLIVYFMGILSGFIFFFVAIFGTLYAAVAAIKVGTIAEKAGDNVNQQVAGKPIADMTILDIVKGVVADFKSEEGLTIGKLNSTYGVDLIGLLEGAVGITLDDKDVLVKVSDVDAYVSGDTEKLTRYALNGEGATMAITTNKIGTRYEEAADGSFVKMGEEYVAYDAANTAHTGLTRYAQTDIVETLPIGKYFKVELKDGKNVLSYLDNDTWKECTTRYDIVNDAYGANADGGYYFVRGGVRASFADFSLANVSEMTTQLLNIFTLGTIGGVAGITFPDMALINDYMTLPVQQALQSIMDLVDGIENKTINELDGLLGLGLGSQDIFAALGDYSLSTIDQALNELTLGQLVSVDRDIYVKTADLAAYKAGTITTLNRYISRYDADAGDIVEDGAVEFSATTYKVEGGRLYEMINNVWEPCDEGVLYKLEDSASAAEEGNAKELVVAEDGYTGVTYVKIHKGEGILNALADASIGNIQDSIGSIKLGDVMTIYEEDVYEESSTGGFVLVGNEYVPYDAVTHGTTVTRYALAHAKSTAILVELKDTSVNGMSDKINDITIEKMLPDFDRDLYILASDLAAYAADNDYAIKTYVNKVDATDAANPVLTERGVLTAADYVITASSIAKDGTALNDKFKVETDNTDPADVKYKVVAADDGGYIRVHIGESTSVLKALADATLDTMDSSIGGMTIGEVMDIYTEDVYEEAASGAYVFVGGEYVAFDTTNPAHTAAGVKRYNLTHEKSTPILIELRNTNIDNMSSAINDITIEKMMPDFDRDLYILASDLAAFAAGTITAIPTYISKIDDTDPANATLTERGTLNTAAYDLTASDIAPKGGSVLTDYYSVVDKNVDPAVYENELSYTVGGDYIKVHVGTSSSVLKALADTTLNTMDSSVSGLKIGEVMDIYPEDVYEPATAANSAGVTTFYKLMGGAYQVWNEGDAEDNKYVKTHEKSNGVLIELRNSKIDEMSSRINDIALEKIIPDFDRDLFISVADLAAATTANDGTYVLTAYTNKAEGTPAAAVERGSIVLDGVGYRKTANTLEWYDADNGDWVAMTEKFSVNADGNKLISDSASGTYLKAYSGKTSAVLKVLADSTLNNMDSSIQSMTLGEVVEIEEEDRYEDYDSTNPEHASYTRFYKKITIEGNDYYVKWAATDEPALRLVKVTERSSGMLVSLKNEKVTELGNKANETMKTLTLSEVVEVDSDIYRVATPDEYAAITGGIYADYDNAFYNDEDGVGLFISYDAALHAAATNDKIYVRIYKGIDNAIMRKMAYVKVGDIGGKMTDVINDVALKDVITIVEENTYEEAADGQYAVLADVLATEAGNYYGSYEIRYYNDGTDDRAQILVQYHSSVTYANSTRYKISQEKSSAALVAMAGLKVGKMGTEMQDVIDGLRLDQFIAVDGDVYTKLAATAPAADAEEVAWLASLAIAQAEAGVGNQVYVDDRGMFRSVSAVFADNDAEVKTAAAGGWYVRIYKGATNAVLKKVAGVSVVDMPNRIGDATDDCTLRELGITTNDGSLLDAIADSKLKDMDTTVTNTLANSTLRQINTWGSLGLSDTIISRLNIVNYIARGGTDPAYNGSDAQYDMSAKDFFSRLTVTGTDTNGNPVFGLSTTTP